MSPLLSGLVLLCTAIVSAQNNGKCPNGAEYYDIENSTRCKCIAGTGQTECRPANIQQTKTVDSYVNGAKYTTKTITSNTWQIRVETYVDDILTSITINGVVHPLSNQNPNLLGPGGVTFVPTPTTDKLGQIQYWGNPSKPIPFPLNDQFLNSTVWGILEDISEGKFKSEDENDDQPGLKFRLDLNPQLNVNYSNFQPGNCPKGVAYLDQDMNRCICDPRNGLLNCGATDYTRTKTEDRYEKGRKYTTKTLTSYHWEARVETYVNNMLKSVTVNGIPQSIVGQVPYLLRSEEYGGTSNSEPKLDVISVQPDGQLEE